MVLLDAVREPVGREDQPPAPESPHGMVTRCPGTGLVAAQRETEQTSERLQLPNQRRLRESFTRRRKITAPPADQRLAFRSG